MTTLKDLATENADGPGYIEAHELRGLEDYCAGAYVFPDDSGDSCTVYLLIQESLSFHGEYGSAALEMDSTTSEWTLTDEAFKVLPGLISERYNGEGFDMAGDVISFELPLTLPASTKVENVAGLLWEGTKVVQFINESDPGTFGSPYLFGTVMADAMNKEG